MSLLGTKRRQIQQKCVTLGSRKLLCDTWHVHKSQSTAVRKRGLTGDLCSLYGPEKLFLSCTEIHNVINDGCLSCVWPWLQFIDFTVFVLLLGGAKHIFLILFSNYIEKPWNWTDLIDKHAVICTIFQKGKWILGHMCYSLVAVSFLCLNLFWKENS